MKIKVCGMRNPENIRELSNLAINFMGLIFYPKSARYVADLDAKILDCLPQTIERVGVFVNADLTFLSEKITYYKLDLIQLHGQESVDYCKEVARQLQIPIIKAFNIADESDLEQTKGYKSVCDYFLFDTKTPLHGGSGLKFDWQILNAYKGDTPFFLSGGISNDDVEAIKKLSFKNLYALDLNSKFEIEPAVKNIDLLKQFIKRIKT